MRRIQTARVSGSTPKEPGSRLVAISSGSPSWSCVTVSRSSFSSSRSREIAEADKRLEAVIFGAEDYAASVGATRTKEATEVLYARSAVVAACAANDLQAIDMVYINFKDSEGLRLEAEQGAGLGFSGKQVIHPNQVPVAQEAFTPSDDAIAYAKRVVESFESSQKEGKGAYALDGKMIDMPLLKNAQKVLDRAKAAGKV